MSDTMDICGLKAERGQKLQTYIPVLDSNTKIPITIINGQNDGPTLLIKPQPGIPRRCQRNTFTKNSLAAQSTFFPFS